MLADIVAVKEQSEWVGSAGAAPGERRGKRHFRDCETACESFRVHRELRDDAMLKVACGECTLRKSACDEARMVMEIASVPDGALDFRSMPSWLVRGIGFYRALNRGGF